MTRMRKDKQHGPQWKVYKEIFRLNSRHRVCVRTTGMPETDAFTVANGMTRERFQGLMKSMVILRDHLHWRGLLRRSSLHPLILIILSNNEINAAPDMH